MKKYILLFVFGILAVSCSSESENPSQNPEENIDQIVYRGVGTEPFWAFEYSSGNLLWQEPGESGTISSRLDVEETHAGEAIVLNGGALSINIMPGECSDGMSDREYSYVVNVNKGETMMSGCAFEAQDSEL